MAKPSEPQRSAKLDELITEARRVVAAWDAGEYDDAQDAAQEADELLEELREQTDLAELLGQLERMSNEACQILVDVYGEG